MTERQLHIRAYRTARGAGLDSDRAHAVAHKVVERFITNTPWPHDDNPQTDLVGVDRITRRVSLAETATTPLTSSGRRSARGDGDRATRTR
jgi:hypothetical protein